MTALQANTNPSTTALYYVTELNCLAKWDGEKYVQINIDTGSTSIEVVGDGNAVTAASYDPATRKLTLTAGATYTTAADVDEKIADKIGNIGEDTVKAYVDKKTDGIATDVALEAMTNRVTTAEGKLDKLNGDKGTDGSVAKAVADLQGDTDATVADVDARVGTIEDNYVDQYAIDTSIADAIGTNPSKKTVAELIADAQAAATYDDTVLSGKVDTLIGEDTGKSARTIANEELAKQLIPDNSKESLDTLAEIAAWIQAHPGDASAMNQAIADLKTLVGALPEDAESATVVAYIKEYADAAIAALEIGNYAKVSNLTAAVARIEALEDDTHTHENKNVLDGVTAEKVAAWNGAEQNAKNYTDEAMTWGTF